MPGKTSIEWCDASWNPVTGCTKVSAGCDHCYAETFAERFRGVPGHPYEQGFDLKLWPERLMIPHRWTKPRRIFVNSMSDLFHADVPTKFIAEIFSVMATSPRHTYLILTKRPRRMRDLLASPVFNEQIKQFQNKYVWFKGSGLVIRNLPLPNVWLGVSVEDQAAAFRVDALVKTPAAVRFLSCEPLLGAVNLDRWLWRCPRGETDGMHGVPQVTPYGTLVFCWECNATGDSRPYEMLRPNVLHWVIVGGESGAGFRPLDLEWARSLRDQAQAAGVPFFFKQVGGFRPKAGGRELDGRTWDEFPETTGAE